MLKSNDKAWVKAYDALIPILFYDPVAIPVTKILHRCHVHPTAVTLGRIVTGAAAAYLLLRGHGWFSAGVFYVSVLCDAIDGKLARLSDKKSRGGARIDCYGDIAVNAMLFLSLGWVFVTSGQPLWCVFIVLHYVFHFIRPLTHQFYETQVARAYAYYSGFDEAFVIFFAGPLCGYPGVCLAVGVLLTPIHALAVSVLKPRRIPDVF